METPEFLDHLYQLWTKTTHASDRFWDFQPEGGGLHAINAVGEDGGSLPVAWGVYEADADWITALHGCFPDLYRVTNEALDEAARLDLERDSRECRIAELEAELRDAYLTIGHMKQRLDGTHAPGEA